MCKYSGAVFGWCGSRLLAASRSVVALCAASRMCVLLCCQPVWVKPSTDIFSLLDEFQSGRSHLALVSEHLHHVAMAYHAGEELSADTTVCGLVTFEDLIEAVLATSIDDEFDSADRMADGTVVESHVPGSRRSAAQRRIVDPRSANSPTSDTQTQPQHSADECRVSHSRVCCSTCAC